MLYATPGVAETWRPETVGILAGLDRLFRDAETRSVKVRANDRYFRISKSGDELTLLRSSGPAPKDRPDDAIPHSVVVSGSNDITLAWLADGTDRYAHGVLGDEQFFGLLTELSSEFRFKELSTEQLRQAAFARAPKDYRDRELRDFFEQWVTGTGIPRFSVRYDHKDGAIAGELRQQGVPEHFTTPVTLRAVFEGAGPVDVEVWTDGERTPFRIPADRKPLRVEIDPEGLLLAVKQ